MKKRIVCLFVFMMLVLLPLSSVVAVSLGSPGVDTDGDNISDELETKVFNTLPNNPDSDGDTYKDGDEVMNNYNPLGEGKLSDSQIITIAEAIVALNQTTGQTADSGFVANSGVTTDSGTVSTSVTGTPSDSTTLDSDLIVDTTGITLTSADGTETTSGETAESGTSGDKVDNTPKTLENIVPASEGFIQTQTPIVNDFGSFTSYTEASGLKSGIINKSVKDRLGNIWMISKNGLIKFDYKNYFTYTTEQGLPTNEIKDISVDRENVIWLATSLGVVRFDPAKELNVAFIFYNAENGLTTTLGSTILADSKGNVWLGTQAGGIFKFNGTTWTHIENDELISNATINTMAETKSGDVFVGTESKGLFVFSNNQMKQYETKDGLISNQVKKIAIDVDDTIYVATNFGVSKFIDNLFSTVETRGSILGTNISGINVENKNIWLSTEEGLNFYNDTTETWTTITKDSGLSGALVTSILNKGGGELVLSSNLGLISYLPIESLINSSAGLEAGSGDNAASALDALTIPDSMIEEETPEDFESGNLIDNALAGDIKSLGIILGPIILLLLVIYVIAMKKMNSKSDSPFDLMENAHDSRKDTIAQIGGTGSGDPLLNHMIPPQNIPNMTPSHPTPPFPPAPTMSGMPTQTFHMGSVPTPPPAPVAQHSVEPEAPKPFEPMVSKPENNSLKFPEVPPTIHFADSAAEPPKPNMDGNSMPPMSPPPPPAF